MIKRGAEQSFASLFISTGLMQSIVSATDVNIEWLSHILQVTVKNFHTRKNTAFNSSIAHLEVEYASDHGLPQHVLIKINKDHDGQNEIQFYRFAQDVNLSMIPRIISMDYEAESGLSYLLMEDVSSTHELPVKREQLLTLNGVPSPAHLDSMIDAIAEFHAAFWEHPLLGTIPVTTEMRWWYRDEDSHKQHVQRRSTEWAKFIELYKDEVPKNWLTLGKSALEVLPRLFEDRIKPRLSSRRALTMSQGDCYLTQFLVPHTGEGKSYLIDFQDASINFPTYDLVYMFATFWSREQRAQYEKPLLAHYHSVLQERGVDYDWDLLQTDYRLCLCYMLFDAIWNAVAGSSKEYWKPKLKCLMNAYQDWECETL